jgi:hypothetical protein
MTLGDLLDSIRGRYLTQFRDSIAEISSAGRRAIVEPALRDECGTLVGEGALRLPLRGDVFVVDDGQPAESCRVDSESVLLFEPIRLVWGNVVQVRVTPFPWDGCDVRVIGIPSSTDWARLRDWFDKWFDAEDTRQAGEQGLSGVIHFLSDPEHDGSAATFQVDFGSAPVEAFEGLMDALRESGATGIEIGNDQA